MDQLVPAARADVELAFSCTHFARVYALNRFLALVLAEYLEKRTGKNPLLPRVRLNEVRGVVGHVCASDPNVCHGQLHNVTFVSDPDCRREPTEPSPSRSGYTTVIVRHGVKPPAFIYGGGAAGPPRQVLPHYAIA